MDSNNTRIAKNTIMLYARMLASMVVSLYSSRIILNTLGVEDYGIYNVVGGLVAILSFLNGAMAQGTQRFLTFEIGRNDKTQLSRVFSMSLSIHIVISLLVFVFAESIGLWFVNTQLVIPQERIIAANWVYQLSVLSAMITIWSVPYNAIIIAHERMNVYAYVSIVDVTLRLLIVFLLQWFGYDKLKFYAILAFFVSLLIPSIYTFYCKKQFSVTSYKLFWDKELSKSMVSYAGWNLWGNIAVVSADQGVNILLNLFFGPAINAARAISISVKTAINSFVQNFQIAINPQIIKSYAENDLERMHQLIFLGAKYSFFLLFFLSLPILVESEYILKIWLKQVPEFTVLFTNLIIVNILIDCISGSLITAAQASGKIKVYQGVVGGLLLLILPISYLFLKLGFSPEVTLYISIIISLIAFVFRLYIISRLVNLSLYHYLKNVIYRIIPVVLFSLTSILLIKSLLKSDLKGFIIICTSSLMLNASFMYLFGLSKQEKLYLHKLTVKYLNK